MRKIAVVAFVFVLTLALCDRAHAGASPHLQGNTSLTLADGSELHSISSFRADVDTDSAGNTTALNEATLEVEIAFPPGPPSVPGAGAFPPGPPSRYMIRGEASTSIAQPSLMIALLLLQHGYATPDQITQTLGFTVTITRTGGNSATAKLPSDLAVFGLLFAQVSVVDPNGSVAVSQLFNQINLHPPSPCTTQTPGPVAGPGM